jgi:hypothetical protein
MLLARAQIPQEDYCPVPDEVLGKLYRASPQGRNDLIATVGSHTRAMLALYCYRRAHLQSLGLVIAATCAKDELETFGGNFGKALFEKARAAVDKLEPSRVVRRRKVTLSSGLLRPVVQDEDDFSA